MYPELVLKFNRIFIVPLPTKSCTAPSSSCPPESFSEKIHIMIVNSCTFTRGIVSLKVMNVGPEEGRLNEPSASPKIPFAAEKLPEITPVGSTFWLASFAPIIRSSG